MKNNLTDKLKLSQQEMELCPLTNVFDKIDIKIMTGSCIYGWKRGDKWLYIGSSENGLRRILDRNHGILDIPDCLYSNDKLYVWYFPWMDKKQLQNLENLIIKAYIPDYNVKHSKNEGPKEHRITIKPENVEKIRRILTTTEK